MRIIFIYYLLDDRGSAQDITGYTKAAKKLGHEVVVYGRSDYRSTFHYSQTINENDAIVFIFEWTTELLRGGHLDYIRLVSKVPRHRRVVIDCDGKYNNLIHCNGDYNHATNSESKEWIQFCDSLSDKIYQPTPNPIKKNVKTFFFHAYNQDWEISGNYNNKKYGMVYVGNNWFRWIPMYEMLKEVQHIQRDVGKMTIIGHGWDKPAPWAKNNQEDNAHFTDPQFLKSLSIKVSPPILYSEVIKRMSDGVFNPVIYRPLFDHLDLVTCRTYETFAANTIPLFKSDQKSSRTIYGNQVEELILGCDPKEKIIDVINNPSYYFDIVKNIRNHLRINHSHEVRLLELIDMINL